MCKKENYIGEITFELKNHTGYNMEIIFVDINQKEAVLSVLRFANNRLKNFNDKFIRIEAIKVGQYHINPIKRDGYSNTYHVTFFEWKVDELLSCEAKAETINQNLSEYRCLHCNKPIPNDILHIHAGECYCDVCRDWNLLIDCKQQ